MLYTLSTFSVTLKNRTTLHQNKHFLLKERRSKF